jgi:hypothetical protein
METQATSIIGTKALSGTSSTIDTIGHWFPFGAERIAPGGADRTRRSGLERNVTIVNGIKIERTVPLHLIVKGVKDIIIETITIFERLPTIGTTGMSGPGRIGETIAIVAMLPTIGAEVMARNFVLIVKTVKGPFTGTIGRILVKHSFKGRIVKFGTIVFIGHCNSPGG